MRLCRFDDGRLGVLEGEVIHDVTGALDVLPPCAYPLPQGDPLIANLPAVRERVAALRGGSSHCPLSQVKLLSPVASPGKIVAAPVNYRRHLEEARADAQLNYDKAIDDIQRTGLFLKATSSLVGAGEGVRLWHRDRRNDHEIELVAVIGRVGRDIPRARALEYVAGYSIGLDMTLRGPEERSLRKSADTFSVLGPCLVTAEEIVNPAGLNLRLSVNGQPRQAANTRDLLLGVPELIAFASSFYTLYAGDLLFTGTPEGVGPVVPGDEIVAEMDRIGRMAVRVR
jgi:2,4-didehydro-3-deoxy-L-rhamnonate hydrolase